MPKCECIGGCANYHVTAIDEKSSRCNNSAEYRMLYNGREFNCCEKCKMPSDTIVARIKKG